MIGHPDMRSNTSPRGEGGGGRVTEKDSVPAPRIARNVFALRGRWIIAESWADPHAVSPLRRTTTIALPRNLERWHRRLHGVELNAWVRDAGPKKSAAFGQVKLT